MILLFGEAQNEKKQTLFYKNPRKKSLQTTVIVVWSSETYLQSNSLKWRYITYWSVKLIMMRNYQIVWRLRISTTNSGEIRTLLDATKKCYQQKKMSEKKIKSIHYSIHAPSHPLFGVCWLNPKWRLIFFSVHGRLWNPSNETIKKGCRIDRFICIFQIGDPDYRNRNIRITDFHQNTSIYRFYFINSKQND